MNNFEKLFELAGRIMISAIFLLSGLDKVAQYAGTHAYIAGGFLVIAARGAGALSIDARIQHNEFPRKVTS